MSGEASCPHADRLAQLVSGELADPEADSLSDHAESCPACAETLRHLSIGDTLHIALAHHRAASAPDPDDAAAVRELIERLRLLPRHFSLADAANSPSDDAELARALLLPAEAEGELGRLGPYRVLGVLGSGGMGAVFEAEDPQLGRRVALKVMQPALLRQAAHRLRFLREARAAAAIEHDHIVPIYHVGEERGVPFLVMPLLKGESLETRLGCEGRLPPAEVVQIGTEIALGLSAAHERGLVHRDIKPANIWLERQDRAGVFRVKILDFGLAREPTESQLTHSGVIAGTPAFMAPEQALGHAIDARSDLFSLGCVLYQACTGRPPFAGTSGAAVLLAVMECRPKPLREAGADVPADLDALVRQLLEREPSRRVPTARQVADALRAIRAEAPSVPSDEPLVQDRSPRTRSARHWALAGTIGAVLLGAILWVLAGWVLRVETDQGTVVLEFADEAAAGASVFVDDQFTIRVALDPGDEPLTMRVSDGDHTLKVVRAGFEVFTRDFRLKAGQRERLRVRLVPTEPARAPPQPAQGSILTFDILNPGAHPVSEDFPEGFLVDQTYGDRVDSPSQTTGTVTFGYGVGSEGITPNVTVSYGPFSIFTGGPTLWRYDYGDLDRILRQGSKSMGVGFDYDFLDIVLVADPGWDVVLYDFDLGGWFKTDYTIASVTAFDGIPFPFLTPTNQIYEQPNVLVEGDGPSHTHFDFGGTPLTSHVIWLRIDASNLGADSVNIGIDNIRFGQVENVNSIEEIDPEDIENALQSGAVAAGPRRVPFLDLRRLVSPPERLRFEEHGLRLDGRGLDQAAYANADLHAKDISLSGRFKIHEHEDVSNIGCSLRIGPSGMADASGRRGYSWYSFIIWPDSRLSIMRYDNTYDGHEIAQTKLPPPDTEGFYSATFSSQGDVLTAVINGKEELRIRDDKLRGPGMAGLTAWKLDGEFRGVEVVLHDPPAAVRANQSLPE